MTTPERHHTPRSPSGFAGGLQVDALRRIEDTGNAVSEGLPVRTFYPTEESAAEGVVAHFECSPDDSWTAFGDVARGPHGLVISRIEITPAKNSTGVTGGLLRKIPTGEILATVRKKAAWEAAQREGTRALLAEEPAPGLFVEKDAATPRRGGRAPITPELLRKVALAYLEETDQGSAPGPMKRMAERFGRPEETVRTWVTRARKDGWLGPGTKGRTGAEPGPKLHAYMAESFAASEKLRRRAVELAPLFGVDLRGQIKRAMIATEDQWVRELADELQVEPIAVALAAESLNSERTVFFDDYNVDDFDHMAAEEAAASREMIHQFQLERISEVLRQEGLLPS